MKKLLLTLGTITAMVAPITSVVACGSNQSYNAKVMTEKGVFNYLHKNSADLKMITYYNDQLVLSIRTLADVSSDLLDRAIKAPLDDDEKVFALVNLTKDELLKVVKYSPANAVQIVRNKYSGLIENIKKELARDTISKYNFPVPIIEGWEGIFITCNGYLFDDLSLKSYDDRQELYDFIKKHV